MNKPEKKVNEKILAFGCPDSRIIYILDETLKPLRPANPESAKYLEDLDRLFKRTLPAFKKFINSLDENN